MTVLDAPTRESCTVRRARTNTPTAALTLMNDEQFVEAARCMAQSVMKRRVALHSRLQYAFLLTTSRRPDAAELQALEESLLGFVKHYESRPRDAEKLIAVGESSPDTSLSVVELAAWTLLCNLLLNLDETLSKG